ncbi:hypothetical protein GQ55_3G148800 [Panicum hallii var. hallii]|uniref:Uncharacterized protein n=1 Tax=Panicum hallii var. hallii TaxID=1504633 RepID=A0A2T7E9L0_9POAL|nr:hypothetical protein GQ55_3G148800 [Panicum hallii var. hallii]
MSTRVPFLLSATYMWCHLLFREGISRPVCRYICLFVCANKEDGNMHALMPRYVVCCREPGVHLPMMEEHV